MSYVTWADVVNKYPSVSKTSGAMDVTSSYILAAEARVNGFFSGFFTVPFSSNNITAKDLVVDLVFSGVGNQKIKDAKEMRDEVLERMKAIRDGEEGMYLVDGTTMTTDIGGSIYSSTQNYNPIFGMSPIEYSEIDSGAVYDEEVARGYWPE